MSKPRERWFRAVEERGDGGARKAEDIVIVERRSGRESFMVYVVSAEMICADLEIYEQCCCWSLDSAS